MATKQPPLVPPKPQRPTTRQDAEAIARAESEGMGQPQHAPPRKPRTTKK